MNDDFTSADDLPYGPGQSDYEYDTWRQQQDDDAQEAHHQELLQEQQQHQEIQQ